MGRGCHNAMKRVSVIAGGIVQGVCFRYYAQRKAEELGLTGWVRNISDGRIEAVIEGEDGEVDCMVQWFRHGPPDARVDEFTVREQPYRGEFDDFRVSSYWR
jgi:acylphosphatase